MNLSCIRLLVVDFDGCFRFYRDALGFPVIWGEEGGGFASFRVGEGIILAIFLRRLMAEAVGTAGLPAEAACQDRAVVTFAVDDLDAAVANLQDRGFRPVSPPRDYADWGIRAAHFRDPDGNLLELNTALPRSAWTEELARETDDYARLYGQTG